MHQTPSWPVGGIRQPSLVFGVPGGGERCRPAVRGSAARTRGVRCVTGGGRRAFPVRARRTDPGGGGVRQREEGPPPPPIVRTDVKTRIPATRASDSSLVLSSGVLARAAARERKKMVNRHRTGKPVQGDPPNRAARRPKILTTHSHRLPVTAEVGVVGEADRRS